jgi:uncharacterized Zn finger protein
MIAGTLLKQCEACGLETEHTLTKSRSRVLARCSSCGHTAKVEIKEDGPVPVKVMVSRGERTRVHQIELPPEDEIAVGDELMVGTSRVKVRSIESGGQRVEEASAEDIDTVWATFHDHVVVHFSVNRGSKTQSFEVKAKPEEEFEVNELESVGGLTVLIHSIKTETRTLRSGSARAEEIVRVYATPVREKWGR